MGHIERELALVSALRQHPVLHDAVIRFVLDENPVVQERARRKNFTFWERPENLTCAADALRGEWTHSVPDIFILDSVDHDQHPAIVRLLQEPQIFSVAIFDDPLHRQVHANLAVNALPNLSNLGVCMIEETTYLLGKDYFIQPPEFAEYHICQRFIVPHVAQAFAFFGGADLDNFTEQLLDVIPLFDELEWTLLLGTMYLHRERVCARIESEKLSVKPVTYVKNMAQQLFETDIAILASGNTLAEAAAVGTPMATVCQNEVQRENARYFQQHCGVPCLGRAGEFLPMQLAQSIRETMPYERRCETSRLLKAQIDGRGAIRVAEAIVNGWNAKRRTV